MPSQHTDWEGSGGEQQRPDDHLSTERSICVQADCTGLEPARKKPRTKQRVRPDDPLKTTGDVHLCDEAKRNVRQCYHEMEHIDELPKQKALFQSTEMTDPRSQWLHIACKGHRGWERGFCAVCLEHHDTPENIKHRGWWVGTSRFDRQKLIAHESSAAHKAAVKLHAKGENVQIVSAFVVALNSCAANVKHKIRDAYFVAKENIPLVKLKKFYWLNRLHGIDSSARSVVLARSTDNIIT